MQLLTGLHAGCFHPVEPKTFEVFVLTAMHVRGNTLRCLDEASSPGSGPGHFTFTSPDTLEHAVASIQREEARAAASDPDPAIEDTKPLDEEELLNTGYGFGEDVQNSTAEALDLDAELGASLIEAKTSSEIRAAMEGPKSSQQTRCDDLGLIEEAVSLVRQTHADAGNVLTPDEIEEEAVLLIIRQLEKEKTSKTRASAQAASASASASSSTAPRQPPPADEASDMLQRSRAPRHRQKYKCFENDDTFLLEVLPQAEQQNDSDSEEMVAEAPPDAAHHGRERSKTRAAKAADRWTAAMVATLHSILDRHRRCQKGAGFQDEVSLLVTTPNDATGTLSQALGADTNTDDSSDSLEVVCVRWTDPSMRMGRCTRIDSRNRVVWSPPFLFGREVPAQHFAHSRFSDLLHASGAQSRKFKSSCRDAFPEIVQRFLAFSRLAISYANHVSRKRFIVIFLIGSFHSVYGWV